MHVSKPDTGFCPIFLGLIHIDYTQKKFKILIKNLSVFEIIFFYDYICKVKN